MSVNVSKEMRQYMFNRQSWIDVLNAAQGRYQTQDRVHKMSGGDFSRCTGPYGVHIPVLTTFVKIKEKFWSKLKDDAPKYVQINNSGSTYRQCAFQSIFQ